MEMQSGGFRQWPLRADWEQQSWLLELMYMTWQTWQFCLRTKSARHKWTEADINFDTWLNQGRPEREQLSEYERWLQAQDAEAAA